MKSQAYGIFIYSNKIHLLLILKRRDYEIISGEFEVSSNQAMLFSRIDHIIGIQTSKCPNTNGIISVTGSYKCGYAFLQIDPTVIAYIIMHSTKYVFNLFSVIAKCLNK